MQDKVKSSIESMTGLEVADVNINIASVDMEKTKKESNPFLFFFMGGNDEKGNRENIYLSFCL